MTRSTHRRLARLASRLTIGAALGIAIACGGGGSSDGPTAPTVDDPRGSWTGTVDYPAAGSAAAYTEHVDLHVTSVASADAVPRTVAGTVAFGTASALALSASSAFTGGRLALQVGAAQSSEQPARLDCTLVDASTCVGTAHGPQAAVGLTGTLRLTR